MVFNHKPVQYINVRSIGNLHMYQLTIKMWQAHSATYIAPKINQRACELISALAVYLIYVYGV
jgi:hypothetical protein